MQDVQNWINNSIINLRRKALLETFEISDELSVRIRICKRVVPIDNKNNLQQRISIDIIETICNNYNLYALLILWIEENNKNRTIFIENVTNDILQTYLESKEFIKTKLDSNHSITCYVKTIV